MYSLQGSERFTDFGSRPARRAFGGLARRSSGEFTRRPSGGLARRHFYPLYFLSAVFMAEWRGVLGKSGCCEEECKPLIIRDAGGAPRESPWHHLVSPIRFANGGT